MIDKEVYIKANVPTSIYNAIYGSYYGEGDVYKLIYNRCYSYDNYGICSMDDYYRACMDYINKMKYEKNGIKKWIKAVSWHYVSPTWKENLKEQFDCKNNVEFEKLVARMLVI